MCPPSFVHLIGCERKDFRAGRRICGAGFDHGSLLDVEGGAEFFEGVGLFGGGGEGGHGGGFALGHEDAFAGEEDLLVGARKGSPLGVNRV